MDYRCTACTRVTGRVADWYPLSFSFNLETSQLESQDAGFGFFWVSWQLAFRNLPSSSSSSSMAGHMLCLP